LVLLTALAAGCSSSGASSHPAGAGASGGTNTGTHGWTECTASFVPTDSATLTAAVAGSYHYVPLAACMAEGVSLSKGMSYPVTVSADPPTITVTLNGAPHAFAWDNQGDLACATDTNETLQISSDTGYVRAGFIIDQPATLLVDDCLGTLGP
jgi:YD repeat-containing protein